MATAERATCAKHAMPSPLRVPISTMSLPANLWLAKYECTRCGERIGAASTGTTLFVQLTYAPSSVDKSGSITPTIA